jgi:hypothetical protein
MTRLNAVKDRHSASGKHTHLTREPALKPSGQRQPFGEQCTSPVHLEVDEIRRHNGQLVANEPGLRNTKTLKILERQIEAAPRQITAQILPEICQLERCTDFVGELRTLFVSSPEESQNESSDRVCRVATVAQEIVERFERLKFGIVTKGAKQVSKRLKRKIIRTDRTGERGKHGVNGNTTGTVVKRTLPGIECGKFLGNRPISVSDVVGDPSIGVDCRNVVAQPPGKQDRPDKKILGVRVREPQTIAVGKVGIE